MNFNGSINDGDFYEPLKIDLTITSTPLTAKTRKLKTKWLGEKHNRYIYDDDTGMYIELNEKGEIKNEF
jgi:hypothetical protein